MARRRCRPHESAHCALEDWASFIITSLSSTELGYQIVQLDVERVQTPPRALIPRIAFTPTTVKAIENWYEQASNRLKTIACMYYIAEIEYKKKVSRRQHNYLISKVSTYLRSLS